MNYSLTAKPAAPAPSIRYISSPPEEITLLLGELKLPERLKSSRFDPERSISLRCADVFANPQPSIDVARLAEIAPEDIAPDFLHAGTIPISAALLALRYHSVQTTEEIAAPEIELDADPVAEPVSGPADEQPEAPPVQAGPASTSPVIETPEVNPVINIPEKVLSPAPSEQKAADPVGKLPVEVVPAVPDIPPPPAVPLEAVPAAGAPAEPPAQFISLPPTPTPPAPPTPAEADPADSKSVARPRPTARIPDKRTIFNILPALRRQSTIPKPAAPPAPQNVESVSPQEAPQPNEESPAKSAESQPPPALESSAEQPASQAGIPAKQIPAPLDQPAPVDQPAAVEEPAPWEVASPPPTASEPSAVEPEPPEADPEPEVSKAIHMEHLPPTALKPTRAKAQELESAPDDRLDSQERLQEIFMTEEQLTLDQVLKLCGGLPGIRSCILTKGSSILSTFNVPDGIDLVSLTGNASAMLDAMRASSMRMGLGAIPAVTVHSEKGPVSFFHSDDLAMLIIHADRGFIPGVREKIHDVVVALGESNLPLPLEGSSEK